MTFTRRLWIYGLLLLLSALGVGGLALGLLAREQGRLISREKSAYDTRAAAVTDRARIIAENIELLVGDAQNALMTTLKEAPADEPRPFLTEWQTYNPLVRDVFRATAAGRPVWGAGSDPLREWLVTAPWVNSNAPEPQNLVAQIAAAPTQKPAEKKEMIELAQGVQVLNQQDADMQNRAQISQNVSQYQKVRRSFDEVAKVKSAPAANSSSFGSSSFALADSRSQMVAGVVEADPFVAAEAKDETGSSNQRFDAQVEAAAPVQTAAVADQQAQAAAPARSVPTAAVIFEERFGWAWSHTSTGLHRFGWRELPDGTVIGLELRLEAIKSRLNDLFPTNIDGGENYLLRDDTGRVWQGPTQAAIGIPLVTVPLAGDVLPGWVIAAYVNTAGVDGSVAESGFLLTGTLLVALLVGAILLSGALLLLQARRSELEAVQKTSFVANVSHEFKTPLTTIRLYSELLAEGRVRDETKRLDYLHTIGRETQRLARLVGNVLDFSKLEQGRKQFDRQPLDIAAELHAMLETHEPRLVEAGLTLESMVPPEAFTLTTDRDALQQIVLNLLDNACKYAADGGQLSVGLSATANGGAIIRVGDRGPGVPSAQRERIFEKFHRLDDRLTSAHAGTGLGLSIARQLARGLGGDLRCSERTGGGAEFTLTLPNSLTADKHR